MKKIENNSLDYKKKLFILEDVKKIVTRKGWSKDIFKNLSNKKIQSSEFVYLFPNGYIDLINFTLDEVNKSLENKVKKINIINFPISKRVKKILTLRLEIFDKDKIFYKKTFNHLLLSNNSKIMKKNLYNTVDNIWYLAGDNSTDFSFYTKRITLAVIYINALLVFYNKDLKNAEFNIDKNLKKISKIPKIKERLTFIKENLPVFLKGIIN
tara:strand:- start:148 stop:780 length:633 start_codon:yes stop_codon:yes gene_type:complete